MNSDRQLPAAVEAQMQAYSLAADPIADPETIAAAEGTLRWFNRQLAELNPGPVDELVAHDLTIKRDFALRALSDHGGWGWAKRKQLELTSGQALAICTGGRFAMFEPTEVGELRAWPIGCFGVFTEAPNVAGKKWPPLCPDCQPCNGHRNPYRDGRRALNAQVKMILAKHG
jgi:hypothetical protein